MDVSRPSPESKYGGGGGGDSLELEFGSGSSSVLCEKQQFYPNCTGARFFQVNPYALVETSVLEDAPRGGRGFGAAGRVLAVLSLVATPYSAAF